MSLPAEIQTLLATPEPPELGPGPRLGVESIGRLDEALTKRVVPRARKDLIRATLLLWHDHLDPAHGIVQEIENADGSYLHAILHRREPDYGNAKYWFRRVGQHRCFPELVRRVEALRKAATDSDWIASTLPRGQWDAFRFVDLCEEAAHNGAGPQTDLLRKIQQIEFEVLLEHLCSAA